jgi:hemerythrin-like domain-containing protein
VAKRAGGKQAAGRRSGAAGARPKRAGGTARSAAKRSSSKRSAKRPSVKRAAARPSAGRSAKGRSGQATTKRAATRRTTKGSAKTTASRSRAKAAAKKRVQPAEQTTVGTALRGVVAGAVAAIADKMPWASDTPDAIELLEADHRRMQALLKQGEETTSRGVKVRTELLNTLTRELKAHELIEEKVLYPALQSHPQAKDIVLEGYQEHHVADLLVKELHGLARSDEDWGPKFNVLKENIDHHIEEEEGEMFRTARGIFSRDELQQLGALMAKMKADALAGNRS